MNKVTLYQVSKSDHLVSSNHLELRQFNYDDITPIRDGDGEFIVDKEIKSINLPVQKYVFCQKHWKTGEVSENIIYAAFDDELLELIQCERSKLSNLNNDLICLSGKIGTLKADKVYLEDQCLKLKTELSKMKQMSFWKRLVFLFKGSVE